MAKVNIEKLILLKKMDKTYVEMSKELNVSVSSIHYQCKKLLLTDNNKVKVISDELKEQIKNFYINHTVKETAKFFKVAENTVKKYGGKKRIIQTKSLSERNKNSVYNWRKKTKIKAVEYKGGKCESCGYNKCIKVLSFHHVNPKEKDFTIAGKSVSWSKIENELKKCIMVCANCHGEIHEEMYENGYSEIVNKVLNKNKIVSCAE